MWKVFPLCAGNCKIRINILVWIMSICPKRAARIPIMLPVFLNTIIWSKVLYWIINIQRNMETEVPLYCHHCACWHYSDVTMDAIVSQITSLTIVYSTVLFRRRSKKTSKLCVTGLCAGNSPWTGEFPAQMASNAENVSIWWRHHVYGHVTWRQPLCRWPVTCYCIFI